jgi:chromosome segregation ATPase
MKYEELNKIEVTRKIWPAGKTVQIDAYEAKFVDEALDEIVKWYSTTKDELEKLKTKYEEDTQKLQTDIITLKGELEKKNNTIQENTETIIEYKVQANKTAEELAEKNELIKNQSETILTQNVTTSHSMAEISKLNEIIAQQKNEIEAKNKDLEIHKHNLEEERLAVKVLKEKNDKIEERLNSLTNTLDKICELGVYYKNYAKSN